MNPLRFVILLAILFAALIAVPGLPLAAAPAVELAGQRFTVEIADEPREQAMGLMFRDALAADAGMLFVFAREEPRSFWMRNCRINLDILFFDGDLELINGHFDVPPCRQAQCPLYASTRPARYVLELRGGTAEALGVRPGDRLTLDLR